MERSLHATQSAPHVPASQKAKSAGLWSTQRSDVAESSKSRKPAPTAIITIGTPTEHLDFQIVTVRQAVALVADVREAEAGHAAEVSVVVDHEGEAAVGVGKPEQPRKRTIQLTIERNFSSNANRNGAARSATAL